LWKEYVSGKQTYLQLAEKYQCSIKTIQRKLDRVIISTELKSPKEVIVLMDTTYWKRGEYGVMLFKDAISGDNLYKQYVLYETNELYRRGIKFLSDNGYKILAIVCDGRRGLFNSFENIPIQMCQFHQVAIIRRYLTKKPKLLASQELMELVNLMKETDRESFEGGLNDWFIKWEEFLNQRSFNPVSNRSHYTHKKLRSAYNSLKRNLPWLYTWYDHIGLKIPNTTNAIDGHFSDLKKKLRCHNGLNVNRKKRFIDEFLKA
jgi:hypothetical protein